MELICLINGQATTLDGINMFPEWDGVSHDDSPFPFFENEVVAIELEGESKKIWLSESEAFDLSDKIDDLLGSLEAKDGG